MIIISRGVREGNPQASASAATGADCWRSANMRENDKLLPAYNWQTQARGSNDNEYQIYLACADDGKGNDMTNGKPLKTYDEWLNS